MKKLLVIIDYQNDFINGSLGSENAVNINYNILKKIQVYRNNNDDIVFTMDTHDKNYLNSREGKFINTIHCTKGSYGWQLDDSVKKLKKRQDKVFIKNSFSSTSLIKYLKCKKYKSIEFLGLVTNICVLSNIISVMSSFPEQEIVVDANCVASYDKKLHFYTLNILKNLNVKILNF